jgi:hypothetical protein
LVSFFAASQIGFADSWTGPGRMHRRFMGEDFLELERFRHTLESIVLLTYIIIIDQVVKEERIPISFYIMRSAGSLLGEMNFIGQLSPRNP